jgi:hypothetical protein
LTVERPDNSILCWIEVSVCSGAAARYFFMSTLGVFRDDFYNSQCILGESQFNAANIATASVIPGVSMAGSRTVYLTESGVATAVALTTDTAVNIIAALQNAVAVAVKASQANGGGFATGLGVPNSVGQFPNLFNVSWNFYVVNQNTASGAITLTAGTGVTIATNGTVSAAVIAIATTAIYVAQVTSPTTVTLTRVQ